MKNLQFFIGLYLITLFAACTTQVEMDLPEPKMTKVTTSDEQVTLRSTRAECDAIQSN